MGSVRGNCCGSWPVSGQGSPGQAVRGASWDLLNGDSIQADDLLGFGDWPCGVPLPTLTHRVVAPCIYFIVCIGIKHNTIETDMSYLKLEVTYYPKLTRSAYLLLHQATCNSPQQTKIFCVSKKTDWQRQFEYFNSDPRQQAHKKRKVVPCDRARQWLSPMEMSTTLVVASSSISLGLSAVASEEPQPRQAPQPQAYTWKQERDQHQHSFLSWAVKRHLRDK